MKITTDEKTVAEHCATALLAGQRAREATKYTGIGCKNIHPRGGLMAFCWDAGYRGSRKSVSRLIDDFDPDAPMFPA